MKKTMRQQFAATMTDLMSDDNRVITLLNDIGVWAFRFLKKEYPNRVHNLGIMEQASISVAAGLSLVEYIPFFHTIAPFIVERSYEQLKDDFGYQCINGNFVSVGASFDYSGLGMTHYCPGDVGALLQIPNFEIVLPGTAEEMDRLIKSAYDNGAPTYYRLSEYSNSKSQNVTWGKAHVVKEGSKGTVIAVGTMLDKVIDVVGEHDVTVLYYTTLRPFDYETLLQKTRRKSVLICEPYYFGGLDTDVLKAFEGDAVSITHVGVPHQLIQTYGTLEENERHLCMDSSTIKKKLVEMEM